VATRDATTAWLRAGARGAAGLGLHGGVGGVLAGLRLVAARRPTSAAAADRVAASVAEAAGRHRGGDVGFADYDLVSGPAGVLLANLAGRLPVQAARLTPVLTRLAALGSEPDLAGLRIGAHRNHPQVGWTQGGIVTGLAHGVAGPLAAMGVAARSVRLPDAALRAVRHLSSWLLAERVTDDLGIVSWPRRGPAGTPVEPGVVRRQAWCYGSPGVSWALWTAGRALADAAVCDAAVAAMRTFCAGFDPDVHLDHDRLGVCHGAAGALLVADAFARHTGLPAATGLRDTLADFLHSRLDEVTLLDQSLLSGSTGVLAALLTVDGGDRGWLPCLGLA
jgi:hypothetical protein